MKISVSTIVLVILLCANPSTSWLFCQIQEVSIKDHECDHRNLSFKEISEENPLFDYLINKDYEGVIKFQPFTIDEIGGWDQFIGSITNDPANTFVMKRVSDSKAFPGRYYHYQQIYNGIPVEGGGFTLMLVPNNLESWNGPTTAEFPDGPGDPCFSVATLALNIYEKIEIEEGLNPSYSENQIIARLIIEGKAHEEQKLRVLPDGCEYRLAWRTKYSRNNGAYVGWIDSHSNEMLYETSRHLGKMAPTADFDFQDMPDRTVNGTTELKNDRLEALDHSGIGAVFLFGNPVIVTSVSLLSSNFNDGTLPTCPESNEEWTEDDAPTELFQAFWMTDKVITEFEEQFGIVFENVRIGYHDIAENAVSFDGGTPGTEARFAFGQWEGNPLVEYDVIGHELGHAIIREYISSDQIQGGSLHEGIADMFGVYIESILDSEGLDWVMGDNATVAIRDLENTSRNCFTDIQDLDLTHDRGEALGHWFQLCMRGGHYSVSARKCSLFPGF